MSDVAIALLVFSTIFLYDHFRIKRMYAPVTAVEV